MYSYVIKMRDCFKFYIKFPADTHVEHVRYILYFILTSVVCVQKIFWFEQWARKQICINYSNICDDFGPTQKKYIARRI